MTSNITHLSEKIAELEERLEIEFAKRRARLQFGLERGRVVFEAEILKLHRAKRIGVWDFLRRARPLVVLTAPFIYSLVVPLLALDICISIYQLVCFPVYGVEKVKRRDYLVFDRHHLAYLNVVQKINCFYCSYANGVISYAREIAARTEKHWCPIKHARRIIAAHGGYAGFADFGDADAYQRQAEASRSTRTSDSPSVESTYDAENFVAPEDPN